jgi:hypothetical protein
MKMGKMPPPPKNPYEQWCPFDNLEKDDIFPILDYKGSCPKCVTGRWPEKFLGIYQRMNGHYHVFVPLGIVYCEGCGGLLNELSTMCGTVSIDVTAEFNGLK